MIGRILDGSRKEGSGSNARKEVLIYGAGRAGREMRSSINTLDGIVALGFIDDNPALRGQRVSGLPVFSPLDIRDVPRFEWYVEILLALPAWPTEKKADCRPNGTSWRVGSIFA